MRAWIAANRSWFEYDPIEINEILVDAVCNVFKRVDIDASTLRMSRQ